MMLKYDGVILEKKNLSYNMGLYKKIIKDCIDDDIKVIFINPPKYYLFNEAMNKRKLTERIDFLNEVVDNETVFYFDFESFNERNPKLFLNANHLNVEGAILFSKEVDKALELILSKLK